MIWTVFHPPFSLFLGAILAHGLQSSGLIQKSDKMSFEEDKDYGPNCFIPEKSW
ncbi:MAG: hypothetical protein HXS46_12870 [Theionarchaea archaeon]|nr:hypothetical protein [Theionarchaea archaeon]